MSQVLTTRRQAQEAEQRVQIRQEESLTGQHGQRTATLVRNWLDEQLPVRADRLVFLPDVQCRLLGARLSGYLASVQRSHLDVQVLIARCKPTDSQDLFFFEALIQWLLRWMVALQPDYEILNQALAEVVRTFWINPTQER